MRFVRFLHGVSTVVGIVVLVLGTGVTAAVLGAGRDVAYTARNVIDMVDPPRSGTAELPPTTRWVESPVKIAIEHNAPSAAAPALPVKYFIVSFADDEVLGPARFLVLHTTFSSGGGEDQWHKIPDALRAQYSAALEGAVMPLPRHLPLWDRAEAPEGLKYTIDSAHDRFIDVAGHNRHLAIRFLFSAE